MKARILVPPTVFVLFAAACHRAPLTTYDLVSTGDPKACGSADVVGIIRLAVLPEYPSESDEYLRQLRAVKFELSEVSAGAHDAQDKRVSCDANIQLTIKGELVGNQFPISYQVRGLVDQPGKIAVLGSFIDIEHRVSMTTEAYGIHQ